MKVPIVFCLENLCTYTIYFIYFYIIYINFNFQPSFWLNLEGPMSHDQPTYASVPGIRVYGMMCVTKNNGGQLSQTTSTPLLHSSPAPITKRRARPLRTPRSLENAYYSQRSSFEGKFNLLMLDYLFQTYYMKHFKHFHFFFFMIVLSL